MKIHQGGIAHEVVIGGVHTEVGISNGRMRHVDKVNDLLKVRGGTVGVDVVNGEECDEGEKSKTHCIFNQQNQQIT